MRPLYVAGVCCRVSQAGALPSALRYRNHLLKFSFGIIQSMVVLYPNLNFHYFSNQKHLWVVSPSPRLMPRHRVASTDSRSVTARCAAVLTSCTVSSAGACCAGRRECASTFVRGWMRTLNEQMCKLGNGDAGRNDLRRRRFLELSTESCGQPCFSSGGASAASRSALRNAAFSSFFFCFSSLRARAIFCRSARSLP